MNVILNSLRFVSIFQILYVLVACNPSEPTSGNATKTETSPTIDTNTKGNPIQKTTSIEDKLTIIRTLYKSIEENIDKFTTKKKSYSGELETILEGELVAYLKDNKTVKLVDNAEEDHGPGKNTFYFVNEKLFFLFSQIMTIEMTEKPNIHVHELRLYFDKGEIIDALVKTKTFKHGETIDMSSVPNEKDTTLVQSKEEAEYYSELAEETLEFFKSNETFDEFYGDD